MVAQVQLLGKVFTLSLEVDGLGERSSIWVSGHIRNDGTIYLGGISSLGLLGFSGDIFTDAEREAVRAAVVVLLKYRRGSGVVKSVR